jgi:hypothetical protein
MEKLGIYTTKTTSTSTSAFTVELVVSGRDVGVGTIGNIMIVGVNTSFNSYAKYYNFTGVGTPDGASFSYSDCVIYETSNISGTTVSIDFFPTLDVNYILEVTITPGSSTSTTWSVYYRDESFETI